MQLESFFLPLDPIKKVKFGLVFEACNISVLATDFYIMHLLP